MAIVRGALAVDPQLTECKEPLQQHTWHRHLTVLIPILSIYCCLAFYRINHQSLWVDEVLSLMRADPEGTFLVRGRWAAGHGPLYFRLLHLWANWGISSEFALRSLSALFGAMTVCLVYMTGLRLCDRRVAWMAAMLTATSPFLIWYSQEVRYVILMIATALLAMYTFHHAVTAKQRGWWLLHFCSLILAIAAFVVNVFIPVAQGVYLVCSRTRLPVIRGWIASQLVVFALFIWWANDFQFNQLGGYWQSLFVHVTTSDEQLSAIAPGDRLMAGSAREFTWMALPYTFFTFSVGFSLGPSVRDLHVSQSLSALLSHTPIIVLVGLLFGSLFTLGLAALRGQSGARKFLFLWLAVPIVSTLGISALIPTMAYNVRYVAMSFPAFILILGAGLASVRRPLLQMSLLAAILLVNGLALANYYFNPDYSKEDARSAAQYLEAVAHSGDAIVVVGNGTALKYYYRGLVPLVSWGKAVFDERFGLTDRIQELDTAHDRLWLVSIRPWEVDRKGVALAMLDDRYTRIARKELIGVEIASYRLR